MAFLLYYLAIGAIGLILTHNLSTIMVALFAMFYVIYNLEKLNSLDSYEVYLDGASSFIEITNEKSLNDKELVIPKPTFGKSSE